MNTSFPRYSRQIRFAIIPMLVSGDACSRMFLSRIVSLLLCLRFRLDQLIPSLLFQEVFPVREPPLLHSLGMS